MGSVTLREPQNNHNYDTQNNMNTPQERKDIFFSFYDQLLPEHAEKAKANYDPERWINGYDIQDHPDALNWGFNWSEVAEGLDYWSDISDKLYAETYPLQMTPSSCKAAALERMATPEDMEEMEEIFKSRDFSSAKEEAKPTEDILEEALRITGGDRMNDYGPPDQDFRRTAIMWEQILNTRIVDGELKIKPQDVASCMIALKLSRQTHQGKRDNWVDIAGYSRCGNLCQEVEV